MKDITLNLGSGGRAMHDFITGEILKRFDNELLRRFDDSSTIELDNARLAFTTDSYVASPPIFPGGDIGRLAVCGTVNDLATSGAEPLAISLALIIEEGTKGSLVEIILDSIAECAKEADVKIATGDTKVVEKGAGDGIYINTSGIGLIPQGITLSSHLAGPGDSVMVSGPIGNHEAAIFLAREKTGFDVDIKSDAEPLNHKVTELLSLTKKIRVLKDPTRGGTASALNEICNNSECEITLKEELIPVDPAVAGLCRIVGFDPLYLACEGRMVILCPPAEEEHVISVFGKGAAKIGMVTGSSMRDPSLLLETTSGGIRRLGMLETQQLPRIC